MNVQINEVVNSEYSSFLSTGNLTKDLENIQLDFHILKVMKGLNINLSPSQNLISKRWILSEQTFNQSIIEKFDEISLLDLRKDQQCKINLSYTIYSWKIFHLY